MREIMSADWQKMQRPTGETVINKKKKEVATKQHMLARGKQRAHAWSEKENISEKLKRKKTELIFSSTSWNKTSVCLPGNPM